MHKKLAADLTSLAHSILQMKNKNDVLELKQKAYEVYEKLAVLAYVEEYVNTTPNAKETKEELIEKLAVVTDKLEEPVKLQVVEEKLEDEVVKIEFSEEKLEKEVEELKIEDTTESEKLTSETIEEIEEPTLKVVEEIIEQPFDELEQTLFSKDLAKEEVKNIDDKKNVTLEEELVDTISVDVAADLFEKPVEKKSLNDALQSNIQIGLNDRIAFVKNLFEGNQGDFNRVVSQLNTFKTEKEAKKFINKMVKPDYNWKDKEEYEERFISLVERKFA